MAGQAPALDTNGPELIRCNIIVSALSFFFFLVRIACKGRYQKSFGLDDVLLAVSWGCLVACGVLSGFSTDYYIGTHVVDIVDKSRLPRGLKLLYISEFFVIVGIAVAKTSFCVTLLRLAIAPWHRIFLWFCIITMNIVHWLCALMFFVSCTPVEKKWDSSVPGTCWPNAPLVNFGVFAGVYSATTDFALAVFPWVLVWRLNMRRIEKIGVCLCMSMGILSGVMACVKSAFLLPSLKDSTYKTVTLIEWSETELAVVIMACSIPYLRLVAKEVKKRATNVGGSGASKSTGYNLDHVKSHGPAVHGSRASARARGGAVPGSADDSSERSILGELKDDDGTIVPHAMKIDRRYDLESRHAP